MLRNSVVIVVRTCPRAMPLAMITMTKSSHGFSFLSYMGMGLHLACSAWQPFGAPVRKEVNPSLCFAVLTLSNQEASK